MKFLDISGVTTLWNKIKDYIGTETKKYLPLSGGTMTGRIEYKTPNNTVLCDIGTNGNVNANQGTGWIVCKNPVADVNSTIQGHGMRIYTGNASDTEPTYIEYFNDNIHITFRRDNTNHKYKFNLQKLIDDGYLIEE